MTLCGDPMGVCASSATPIESLEALAMSSTIEAYCRPLSRVAGLRLMRRVWQSRCAQANGITLRENMNSGERRRSVGARAQLEGGRREVAGDRHTISGAVTRQKATARAGRMRPPDSTKQSWTCGRGPG